MTACAHKGFTTLIVATTISLAASAAFADDQAGRQKAHDKAAATAERLNRLPGAKVTAEQLTPPSIEGFHPIKRMFRPVTDLENTSVGIENKVNQLEAPINGLNQPMVKLQKKMVHVDHTMGAMKGQLDGMGGEVAGVRSDLAGMRDEISSLRSPILSVQKPLSNVSQPLEALQVKLNFVIFSIFVAILIIAIGTPASAIVLWKFRDKLLPAKLNADIPREQAAT